MPAKDNGSRPHPADAVELLKADHREIQKLIGDLSDFEVTDENIKRLGVACRRWAGHAALETEFFYPALREAGVDQSLIDSNIVALDLVAVLLADLRRRPTRHQKFAAITRAMLHAISTQIASEENEPEGLFSRAMRADVDLQQLGEELRARKAEIEHRPEDHSPYHQPRLLRDAGITPIAKETDKMRGNERPRDERGRFMDENEYRGMRGRNYASRSRRDYDDDDRRDSAQSSRGYDDDDRRGWYGDSRGHAEAARRGWDERRGRSSDHDDDDRGDYRSRGSRMSDDYRRGGERGRGHGGWFGDSEGHAEASRRGWDNPDHGPSGWYGDSEGHSMASRRGWDNPDHGQSGWYGDPEGHAMASRRGWDERRGHREDDDYEHSRRRRR